MDLLAHQRCALNVLCKDEEEVQKPSQIDHVGLSVTALNHLQYVLLFPRAQGILYP
jgi:hypothetical protein